MGKWTVERIVTVIGIAMTIGVYWQILIKQQDEIRDLKAFNATTLEQTYVRKDVYDINQRNLTAAIDRLTSSLEKLLALEQRTGEPARIQRMFDK